MIKILRSDPLIQQNEIADILKISRSRVAAHIMDLMRKGMIKGKGYILTEQEYCVIAGAVNPDIRGSAELHCPEPASTPGCIRCSAGGVGRNIAHNMALPGHDVHLLSATGSDFYGRTLPEHTRQAGVNVSGCICLPGHNTSTCLSVSKQLTGAPCTGNQRYTYSPATYTTVTGSFTGLNPSLWCGTDRL